MTSKKLQTLCEEEVETEVYRRSIKLMEKISHKYSINLKLLLSEIPNPLNFCRGFKKDGSPCIARAKLNGMCGSHIDQPQLRGPVEMVFKNNDGIRHKKNLREGIFNQGGRQCKV